MAGKPVCRCMPGQIGEFSFVLAAVGLTAGIISDIAYQYTIAVIALSLLVSPFWILAARRILGVTRLATTSDSNTPEPEWSVEKSSNTTRDNQH